MELTTMEMIGIGAVAVVIGLIVFYMSSIKHFKLSELVAIETNQVNTGLRDEDGEIIYSSYRYQLGGKVFIPFWKRYFVVPILNLNYNIPIAKATLKNQFKVTLKVSTKLEIDISTKTKIYKFANRYKEFFQEKVKNINLNKFILEKLEKDVQNIVESSIPIVLATKEYEDLIVRREEINRQLEGLVKSKLEQLSLKLINIAITEDEILNKAYNKTLEEAQTLEMEKKKAKTQEEVDKIKLNREKQKKEMEKEVREIERQLKFQEMEYESELKIKQVEENMKFKNSLQDIEDFHKTEILSKQRAEKEAELILEKLNLEIAEVISQRKEIETQDEAKTIETINNTMKDINGYAGFMILLKQKPNLLKELIGEGGLNEFANNMTKHLSNLNSLNIAELGGKGNKVGGFEKFAFLAPMFMSQMFSQFNEMGKAKSFSNINKNTSKNKFKNSKNREEKSNDSKEKEKDTSTNQEKTNSSNSQNSKEDSFKEQNDNRDNKSQNKKEKENTYKKSDKQNSGFANTKSKIYQWFTKKNNINTEEKSEDVEKWMKENDIHYKEENISQNKDKKG